MTEAKALLARVDASVVAGDGIHRHDEEPLIEALRAALAELAEARAEIAALRGLPEGAVSEHWRWWASGRHWIRRDNTLAFVWRDDEGCYWTLGEGHEHVTAPTLRDAMRAADKAAGVGS